MKVIAKNRDARDGLKRGIDAVHDLIKPAIGPKGGNVVIDNGFGVPTSTNDGFLISQSIELESEVENQGVKKINEAASKTNNMAGNGRKTTLLLSHAIVSEALKYSESPVHIRKSLNKAKDKAISELKKLSKPLKNIRDVALTASGSEEVADIIAKTIDVVGKDGVITVEKSPFPFIESELVSGYELQKGFAHRAMANNDTFTRLDLKNPYILVVDGRVNVPLEILPFLKKVEEKTKELIIFCEDADQLMVNFFIANKVQGKFNGTVVKVLSQKNEILEDIALVTGAKMVNRNAGIKFDAIGFEVLGRADSITITENKTVIMGGHGDVAAKVKALKKQLALTKNDNEYDLLENRIGRLNESIAVIKIGCNSEQEAGYLHRKAEDAVNSIKSAMEEGVVEGGEMSLYRISQKLDAKDIGERILKAALLYPLRCIIENAGREYVDILLNLPAGQGYDADKDTYANMVKSGIVDSTKVERCAIENAVSFAGMFLNETAVIANKRPSEKV